MGAVLGSLAGVGTSIGGMSASMASCVACQACSCVSSAACSYLCGKMCGGDSSPQSVIKNTSRMTYFFLFIITVVGAWVFRYTAPELCTTSDIFCKNLQCPPNEESPDYCMARAFVLRVAFATAIFHISISLLTVGASDFSNPRVMVHTALWPAKIMYWAVLHLVVFFIPSTFFLGFGWVALILGILFLLVQTVIFIEFVFAWNEDWIEKDGAENVQGPWHMAILGVSILALGAAIGQTVVMFMYFGTLNETGESDGCELFQFFASFNLILFVFLTIFSFRATEWMPATGLLPSALVASFLSFKTLSALYSQTTCNALAAEENTYTAPPEVLSGISILIAIVISAYSSSTIGTEMRPDGLFWGPSSGHEAPKTETRNTPLVPMDAIAPNQMSVDVEGAAAAEEALSGHIGYNVAAFHAAIAFSICYIAMQLTNWNQEFSKTDLDKGSASMWIKIVDSWILALAYGWSMIAPKVLTGRSFDY